MKIAILGATGRVGQQVARLAIQNGHQVQALVRNKENAKKVIPNCTLIEGNATSYENLLSTFTGTDVIFSALNTDKTTTLSDSIPLIIKAMEKCAIHRIVTIGTAGILDSRFSPGLYRFQSTESRRKSTFAAEEHLRVYNALNESSLDWTIICPTYLPDGPACDEVRIEEDVLPKNGEKITVGDTAVIAFQILLTQDFLKKRIGICY